MADIELPYIPAIVPSTDNPELELFIAEELQRIATTLQLITEALP
jgi:hypothetical protein